MVQASGSVNLVTLARMEPGFCERPSGYLIAGIQTWRPYWKKDRRLSAFFRIFEFIIVEFFLYKEIRAAGSFQSWPLLYLMLFFMVDVETPLPTLVLNGKPGIVWDSRPFAAAITEENKPYGQRNVKDLKAVFPMFPNGTRLY
jgi:hypothetical protein